MKNIENKIKFLLSLLTINLINQLLVCIIKHKVYFIILFVLHIPYLLDISSNSLSKPWLIKNLDKR
jgi:hypothetical protein